MAESSRAHPLPFVSCLLPAACWGAVALRRGSTDLLTSLRTLAGRTPLFKTWERSCISDCFAQHHRSAQHRCLRCSTTRSQFSRVLMDTYYGTTQVAPRVNDISNGCPWCRAEMF